VVLRRALMVATMITAAGCASAPAPFRDTANLTYAPQLGVDLAGATRVDGIYVNEKAAGAGDAAHSASQVTVHYTLYLPDGTQVQTTRTGEPMAVRLDDSNFLIGRALVGMRPGGRRVLVVPPAQGYGRAGVPGMIPPNSTIVFDVERVR
jgi:FKBP-type peptidyl-prolyl cis-trans isomerase FkpA